MNKVWYVLEDKVRGEVKLIDAIIIEEPVNDKYSAFKDRENIYWKVLKKSTPKKHNWIYLGAL